jgi:hypothetical protein
MLNYLQDSLAGAWTIMRGRREGLARLDLSIEGFWRSFGAIVLLIPFAALALLSQQRMVEAAGDAVDTPGDLSGGGIGVEAVAFLADWVIFPLVFAALARPLGLGDRYVPFIVARNWSAVILAAMLAVVHAVHVLGIVPSSLAPFLLIGALAVALRFSYVVAKTALDVPVGVALGVVVLDFLISLMVWSAADRLA